MWPASTALSLPTTVAPRIRKRRPLSLTSILAPSALRPSRSPGSHNSLLYFLVAGSELGVSATVLLNRGCL
ncbi:hypothetical protein BHE74_00000725 [Ensete ventricosum]|nr:hypothetical protein GW17_00002085 [Ensete ventricosum]RWW90133.1 hypothetical protein BHE74_00000725 [Ensete ventricosum]RZR75806.1 hypothetical protein BHM03_00000293 [Ensete ventricosum]